MNGLMKYIFNNHMRFEINENYNPKNMELLKKLERPMPEIDETVSDELDELLECNEWDESLLKPRYHR